MTGGRLLNAVLVACLSASLHAARDDGAQFTLVEYQAQTNLIDKWKVSVENAFGKKVHNSEVELTKPGEKVMTERDQRAPRTRCQCVSI